MTRTARTRLGLLICLVLILAGVAALAAVPQMARWHRYAMSELDKETFIDVARDVYSMKCYAIYVRKGYGGYQGDAVTNLGEVPCQPVK